MCVCGVYVCVCVCVCVCVVCVWCVCVCVLWVCLAGGRRGQLGVLSRPQSPHSHLTLRFHAGWWRHCHQVQPPSLASAITLAQEQSQVALQPSANQTGRRNWFMLCSVYSVVKLSEVPLDVRKHRYVVPAVHFFSGTKFGSTGTVPKPKENRSVA